MNGLNFKTRETATTTSPFYTRRHREHFNVRKTNVNFKDVKPRGLGGFNIEPLMESSLNTLTSFKKLGKVIFAVHCNTIYPRFLSKTKTGLSLHRPQASYHILDTWLYIKVECFEGIAEPSKHATWHRRKRWYYIYPHTVAEIDSHKALWT